MRPEPIVRAAALEGIGRLRADGYLERAARFVLAEEPDVREAAAFACWMLASKRRQVATTSDPAWDGDVALCRAFLPLLRDADPVRRMAGIRPLGSLLPKAFPREDRFHVIRDLIRDPDPRVTQDVVWRILTRREGAAVDEMLEEALSHDDPKVRHLAAEALGARETEVAQALLVARLAVEGDARLREVLQVELMRLGFGVPVRELRTREDRPDDPALRQLTEARIRLLAKGEDELTDLLDWADVSSPDADDIHPIVWMEIADGLKGREEPAVAEWVGWMFSNAKRMDPYVLASVTALAGENGMHDHRDALTGDVREAALAAAEPDVAQALAATLATLAGDEAVEPEAEVAYREALRDLLAHPSAFARAAVREAMTKLEMDGVPEADDRPANDWRGLPRPAGPVLGLELGGEGPWLDETQILRIADRISEENPRIVFQTTAGAFAVELDAEAAPVHAVSLLLAVQAGVYDGTRWHRVVPNFVIQGGDPHGHGAGGGGWTVPDEISERRYVRGALGMPKSTKDDGGCQLFVMHTAYRPLDGRYTNYGRVVSGMETVDAIRVGDTILGARVVLGAR
jgi:cyclophilin family peptidyl-prolyl cis-trans isomerase